MNNENIAATFITMAIISLLFIAGLVFMILYGIRKKKKVLWITGVIIAAFCILLYIYNYYAAYNRAVELEQEAGIKLNR